MRADKVNEPIIPAGLTLTVSLPGVQGMSPDEGFCWKETCFIINLFFPQTYLTDKGYEQISVLEYKQVFMAPLPINYCYAVQKISEPA